MKRQMARSRNHFLSCRSRYSLFHTNTHTPISHADQGTAYGIPQDFLSCRSPLIHFLFMFPLISPHADQGTSYFTAECHLMPFSHVDLKETLKETHKETQEMGETTPSNTTVIDSLTCTLVCHLLSISHLDLRMRSNIKIVRVSFAKET